MDLVIPPEGERHRHTGIPRLLEGVIFASRWLLAPFYIGMVVSLGLLLLKFGQKSIGFVANALSADINDLIVGILGLIDLSLMANLLLMVMFAGYENFVSRFDLDDHPDKPDWMGHIGFADLKVKLLSSIVAISAIHVLEDFMHVDQISDRELAWGVGIHVTFIFSAVMLAVMDRFGAKTS